MIEVKDLGKSYGAHPALRGVRPGEAVPFDIFCETPHALRSIDGMASIGDVAAALDKVLSAVSTRPEVASQAAPARAKTVAKAAQSFVDFPPMQKGASFNLEAVKEELDKKMAARASQ